MLIGGMLSKAGDQVKLSERKVYLFSATLCARSSQGFLTSAAGDE